MEGHTNLPNTTTHYTAADSVSTEGARTLPRAREVQKGKIKAAPSPCLLAPSFSHPTKPIPHPTHTVHLPSHHTSVTMADNVEKTRAALRAKFDKITAEEFSTTQGNREKLEELVSSKYGISKEDAKKQVEEAFASA